MLPPHKVGIPSFLRYPPPCFSAGHVAESHYHLRTLVSNAVHAGMWDAAESGLCLRIDLEDGRPTSTEWGDNCTVAQQSEDGGHAHLVAQFQHGGHLPSEPGRPPPRAISPVTPTNHFTRHHYKLRWRQHATSVDLPWKFQAGTSKDGPGRPAAIRIAEKSEVNSQTPTSQGPEM